MRKRSYFLQIWSTAAGATKSRGQWHRRHRYRINAPSVTPQEPRIRSRPLLPDIVTVSREASTTWPTKSTANRLSADGTMQDVAHRKLEELLEAGITPEQMSLQMFESHERRHCQMGASENTGQDVETWTGLGAETGHDTKPVSWETANRSWSDGSSRPVRWCDMFTGIG